MDNYLGIGHEIYVAFDGFLAFKVILLSPDISVIYLVITIF